MRTAAFIVIACAVTIGCGLALVHLRRPASATARWKSSGSAAVAVEPIGVVEAAGESLE
jgi:hypothetical protein